MFAVIEFLWDGWRPHSAVLGQPKASRAITTYALPKPADTRPGAVPVGCTLVLCQRRIVRRRCVFDAVARHQRRPLVVVAAEPVTSIDVTAADVLAELDEAVKRV